MCLKMLEDAMDPLITEIIGVQNHNVDRHHSQQDGTPSHYDAAEG